MPDLPPPPDPNQTVSDAAYHRLFELSLDLMCIAGLDGYFKRVNPSWIRVLGWSEAELLARPVEAIVHPDDRARTLAAREGLPQGRPVRGLENRYLCKDGSYRWLSWQSVLAPGTSLVFAVARDITDRRQLDQERLVLSKLESTGILAGGIAHDFNNLLASLMLNLEMVGLSASVTSEQSFHLLQAKQTIQSAQALTLQLIAFAEGSVGTRRVVALAGALGSSFQIALRGSSVRGETDIAPDLWPAEIDEGQFSQVIRSLVLNAREASPRGTVRLRADNFHLAAPGGPDVPVGNYVRIRVEDDGVGIEPETLPKIFDPYFSTKQRGPQKGMGLGLTICRTVVQKHGGAIFVESQPGRGTAVTCLFPARPGESVIQPSARTSAAAGRRILAMDDEQLFREVLASTLRQIGYEVTVARDGDEAIAAYAEAAAAQRPFSAVLLDLTVRGGRGGRETLDVLRQQDPGVRAILMTGYSTEAVFRDYASHGFQAALAKPFPLEALRSVLAEVLSPAAPRT